MKPLFYIIALIFSNFQLMGQYIGIYAKKNGEFCFEQPFFTEEDTELNNKLRSALNQLNQLKRKIQLDHEHWVAMTFTEGELKALKCNFVQDNADDEIEYATSNSTKLPKDFYAIGTKCNSNHCFVYDPKYSQYENWSSYNDVENGLVKMTKIIHEQIKANEGVTDYLLYDFENLNMLYGILRTVKNLYSPDEIAILIAP